MEAPVAGQPEFIKVGWLWLLWLLTACKFSFLILLWTACWVASKPWWWIWEKNIHIYICFRLCIQIGYALITETDPYCYLWLLIPSHKNSQKKTKKNRTWTNGRTVKVFISYNPWNKATLHTKINYSRITRACNKQNMFQVINLCLLQCFFLYSYVLQCHCVLDICCSVCVLSLPECVV